jgi:peptidyl-prolyl cis-trans isomerase SurA
MPAIGQPGPALAAQPDVMPTVETPKVATAPKPAEVVSGAPATVGEARPADGVSANPEPAAPPPVLAESKPAEELPKIPPLSLAEEPKTDAIPAGLAPDLTVTPPPRTTNEPPVAASPSEAPGPVAETRPSAEPPLLPATGSRPDPALAAEPDVMPALVPPPLPAQTTVSEPVAPTNRPDPALAAEPDVMPALVPAATPRPAVEQPLLPEKRTAVELPTADPPLNPGPNPAAPPEPALPPLPASSLLPETQARPAPPLPELPAAMPPAATGAIGKPDPALGAEPDVMPPLVAKPTNVPAASPRPAASLKDAAAAPASTTVAREAEEEMDSTPPIDLPPLPPLDPREAIPAPPAPAKPPTNDQFLKRTSVPAAAPASKAPRPPEPIQDVPELPLPALDPKQALPARPATPVPAKPADTAEPAELPLPALPPTSPVPAAPPSAPPAKSGADQASAPISDPAVQKTAASTEGSASVEMRSSGRPVDYKEAGRAAAVVGDEVITKRELAQALNERIRDLPQGHKFSREEQDMIVSGVLNQLIERSVILQEAKRGVKDAKKLNMINDVADRVFREEELPHLLRKAGATNEFELKEKMKEKGQSLDELRDQFRRDFLARGFLEQKLGQKMNVEWTEMYDYYYAHQHDFDEPARIWWHEVVVEVNKHPSRADAKRKADAILGRLLRGEDFAQVARTESEGPNRASGGLWETSPGSYAVSEVNEALGRLPINQTSTVIEAPDSYHIVRLEKQRDAGPAPFPEVQDRIRRIIHETKVRNETAAFVKKLKEKTVISTMFDQTQDVAIQPASNSAPAASVSAP